MSRFEAVRVASVVLTREVVETLRAHVPANLGVKTSLVPSVQWRGWGHGGGSGSVSRRKHSRVLRVCGAERASAHPPMGHPLRVVFP